MRKSRKVHCPGEQEGNSSNFSEETETGHFLQEKVKKFLNGQIQFSFSLLFGERAWEALGYIWQCPGLSS